MPATHRDGDVGPAALEYAKAVEEYLRLLDAALGDTTPERFTSATAFEGMLNLANEVPAKKISSEEETTSDLSQMIFYNNWKGILSQVRLVCDMLQDGRDKGWLMGLVHTRFTSRCMTSALPCNICMISALKMQAQPFCPRAQAQCEALQEAVKAAAECLDIDTKVRRRALHTVRCRLGDAAIHCMHAPALSSVWQVRRPSLSAG
jgi:hypothetical protein